MGVARDDPISKGKAFKKPPQNDHNNFKKTNKLQEFHAFAQKRILIILDGWGYLEVLVISFVCFRALGFLWPPTGIVHVKVNTCVADPIVGVTKRRFQKKYFVFHMICRAN